MSYDANWLEHEIAVPDLTVKRKKLIELAFTEKYINSQMKNKRYKLKEAEAAVDEITLKDILDMSTKAENSASGLLNAAVDFKNSQLLGTVAKFKSIASEITQYVAKLIGSGATSLGDEEEDTRIALNNSIEVKESAKTRYFKRKKLKESEEFESEGSPDEEEKTKSTNETNDTSGGSVVIDLTEPYEKILDGLDDSEFSNFKSDVVSKLENAIDSVENKIGDQKTDEFTKSIEALASSQSGQDFDFAMNNIYDFADQNDIIVETIKRK